MAKKIFSVALALAMLLAMLPISSLTVSAADDSGTIGEAVSIADNAQTDSVLETEEAVPAVIGYTFEDSSSQESSEVTAETYAGSDSVTWEISDGTLIISGSGAMPDYSSGDAPWYDNLFEIKAIVVSEGITSIGANAFRQLFLATSVSLPSTLTSIGSGAFTSCQSLDSISLPDTLTSLGAGAFESCTSITSISLPKQITSLPRGAFAGCTSLSKINLSNITSIGDYAFEGTAIGAVSIPAGLTSLSSAAFYGASVTAFTVADGHSAYKAVDGVLYSIDGATLVCYPAAAAATSFTIPDSVTSINTFAFSCCSNLTSISFPDSITSIDVLAFYKCSSLTSITFPKTLQTIDAGAFEYCTGLKTLTFPESLTKIASCGFLGCTGLTEITFTGDVPDLESDCFYKVTATVYYPSGGACWDLVAGANYGGTLTWVATGSSTSQTQTYADSGGLTKLSKEEITALFIDNALRFPDSLYEEEPSCSSPYSAGKLSDEALQATLYRLNAIRRLVGVPSVSLDDSYNEMAQYSAVLNAANGTISHDPSQPSDMDDEFYTLAYNGCASSNLAMGYTLLGSVDGFMNDSGSSNISAVGHRRWQMNPTFGKVGFGYCEGMSSEIVFDSSGDGINYQYLSWPSSGYFPNNLGTAFSTRTAWSVTLNPLLYQTPDAANITVTLTCNADGRMWKFSDAQSDGYFNVDTTGYGVDNAIIFRPSDIEEYTGTYTVTITGLQGVNEKDTTLSYQVDFFAMGEKHDYGDYTMATKPTLNSCGKLTSTCKTCGETTTVTMPKLNTTDYTYTVTRAASCSLLGTATYTWNTTTYGMQTVTVTLSRTAHNYVDGRCTACGAPESAITITRLYNPASGEHLLAGSDAEISALVEADWSIDGVMCYMPTSGDPVYRLYNPASGEHLYTMVTSEIETLTAGGWSIDGVIAYSAGSDGTPIYRLYNQNAAAISSHLLSTSREERETLAANGWTVEGIALFALK